MYYQRVVSAIHKFLFASIFWVGWTRVFIPSWWWSRVMCMVHQKLITIKKIHTGFPMWVKFSILINITELSDSIINVQNCSFISTCKFNSPFSYYFKRLEMHFFICILFFLMFYMFIKFNTFLTHVKYNLFDTNNWLPKPIQQVFFNILYN